MKRSSPTTRPDGFRSKQRSYFFVVADFSCAMTEAFKNWDVRHGNGGGVPKDNTRSEMVEVSEERNEVYVRRKHVVSRNKRKTQGCFGTKK